MIVASMMILPFIYIRSTKGLKSASMTCFVSHISFTLAIAVNFFLYLKDDGLALFTDGYFYTPHFSELAGGWK